MIGSHNIPPPPSNDRVFIAAVNGEPETPPTAPPVGKGKELHGGIDAGREVPLVGDAGIGVSKPNGDELVGIELDGGKPDSELTGELGDKGIDIEDVGKLTGMGGNPDIILENSTGSIPDGIGLPEAAAAAIIAAGVGSKVPVITL